MPEVAVLGAGALGSAMAERLADLGFHVRLWNRTAEKATETAGKADGIRAVQSRADAVAGVDAVLSVLRDGDAVSTVVADLLPQLGAAVWIQASTVGPEWASRLRALAEEQGVAFLDAPVSGSTQPARRGALVWLVAGQGDVVERARPVLDALGSTVQVVGEGSEASALKLAVNAWMAAATVAISDVLALCDALEVPHEALMDALKAGPLAMPYMFGKVELMETRDYTPGFSVELTLKDVNLALAATGEPSALLAAVQRRLERTAQAGFAGADLAAVNETARV